MWKIQYKQLNSFCQYLTCQEKSHCQVCKLSLSKQAYFTGFLFRVFEGQHQRVWPQQLQCHNAGLLADQPQAAYTSIAVTDASLQKMWNLPQHWHKVFICDGVQNSNCMQKDSETKTVGTARYSWYVGYCTCTVERWLVTWDSMGPTLVLELNALYLYFFQMIWVWGGLKSLECLGIHKPESVTHRDEICSLEDHELYMFPAFFKTLMTLINVYRHDGHHRTKLPSPISIAWDTMLHAPRFIGSKTSEGWVMFWDLHRKLTLQRKELASPIGECAHLLDTA